MRETREVAGGVQVLPEEKGRIPLVVPGRPEPGGPGPVTVRLAVRDAVRLAELAGWAAGSGADPGAVSSLTDPDGRFLVGDGDVLGGDVRLLELTVWDGRGQSERELARCQLHAAHAAELRRLLPRTLAAGSLPAGVAGWVEDKAADTTVGVVVARLVEEERAREAAGGADGLGRVARELARQELGRGHQTVTVWRGRDGWGWTPGQYGRDEGETVHTSGYVLDGEAAAETVRAAGPGVGSPLEVVAAEHAARLRRLEAERGE